MDRGALQATVHGVAELDTTEATEHTQTHRHREQTCDCQGDRRVGKGCTGSLGLADANYDI